jgi:2-C-methyl-D-erythritol 4-phosphate cytidylyltransferase / 2-C-methyl-D-erythritol 2,4-cyclodiphosphate synthase
MQAVAIVVAAGRGERMGAERPKAFLELGGEPLLLRAARAFEAAPSVGQIVAVVPEPETEAAREQLRPLAKLSAVVAGGERRQDSVLAGLRQVPETFDGVVLVHDAARPLVDVELIEAVAQQAAATGAALPVLPLVDTVKRVRGGRVLETLDRARRRRRASGWRCCARLARRHVAPASASPTRRWRSSGSATPSMRCRDRSATARSPPPTTSRGPRAWLRVSFAHDQGSERSGIHSRGAKGGSGGRGAAAPRMSTLRVGQGFDVHRLVAGRPLKLGGLDLEHARGLEGHSDGDCVLHAICDALLGAIGEGDMGRHFPSKDARWRGVESRVFLDVVTRLVSARGFRLGNLDVTVIAQEPVLGPHLDLMRTTIAGLLGAGADAVSVKAKSSDHLGAIGRAEGIAALATVLLVKEASSE